MSAIRFAVYTGAIERPKTIVTQFVPFRYKKGAPEYKELESLMRKLGVACFRVIGDNRIDFGPMRNVVLETEHLFGDQWNTQADEYTTTGFRVHNWYEDYIALERSGIHKGHYLVINQDMIDLLAKSYRCYYCGAQYYGEGNKGLFCSKCLGSEYLKVKDFPLLRLSLLSITRMREDFPALTDEEMAEMMPLYVERQTAANEEKAKKILAETRDKHIAKMASATMEYQGFIWLLDKGIDTRNIIFYSHTKKFNIGWMHPLEDSVKAKILELLSEFPYEYEFETK